MRDEIFEIRRKYGLTQQQLADKTGLSRSEISRLETGLRKSPRASTMHKLERLSGE